MLTHNHKHTGTYDNTCWLPVYLGSLRSSTVILPRQHCNLDRAIHDAPRWPAIGFSRLASLGVIGVTLLCSTCLSSSTTSRPDTFSWRWQRSKGITKTCNTTWGLGSEQATPTSTLSAKANHKTSLGLRTREIDSAFLVREPLNKGHTIKVPIQGGWQIGAIDAIILPLMRTHRGHICHLALKLYVASTNHHLCGFPTSLHSSPRFSVSDKDIGVARTRSWCCTVKARNTGKPSISSFFTLEEMGSTSHQDLWGGKYLTCRKEVQMLDSQKSDSCSLEPSIVCWGIIWTVSNSSPLLLSMPFAIWFAWKPRAEWPVSLLDARLNQNHSCVHIGLWLMGC